MKPIIVVEGEKDRIALSSLLGPRAAEVEWRIAQGKGSLASVARTHLGVFGRAVALVVDADTSDAVEVQSLRASIEEAILAVGPREPHRVLVAVPALDRLSPACAATLALEIGEFLNQSQACAVR
ncbi:MAG: hypothetical protein HYZ53_26240 [Planctomycetes bacterium]|nr:hypothetical protein [Planctomycetota bacterium]